MRRAARIGAAIGVGGLLLVGLVASTRTGIFRVRGIEVAGNRHLSPPEIVELSGITPDTNAVWLDEDLVEERLEGSGWVGEAEVGVRLPWTVEIAVKERRAVAVARMGANRVLVAGDGSVLGPIEGVPGLPLLDLETSRVGARRAAPLTVPARTAAELPPRLRREVRRIVLTPARTIELVLRDGRRVRMGAATDIDDKISALQDVMRWTKSADEAIHRIDVSAPSAPAVAPGA